MISASTGMVNSKIIDTPYPNSKLRSYIKDHLDFKVGESFSLTLFSSLRKPR